MRRRKAPSYPSPEYVGKVVSMLDRLPKDNPEKKEWRFSYSGNPNLRYSATSGEMPWSVDIYSGNYFRTQVGESSTICRSLQETWNFLCNQLRLTV